MHTSGHILCKLETKSSLGHVDSYSGGRRHGEIGLQSAIRGLERKVAVEAAREFAVDCSRGKHLAADIPASIMLGHRPLSAECIATEYKIGMTRGLETRRPADDCHAERIASYRVSGTACDRFFVAGSKLHNT